MGVDPICLHSVGTQQYPTARLRAAPAAMAAVALAVKHLLLLLGQQLITHLLLLLLLFVRVCAGAG